MTERTYEIDRTTAQALIVACATGCDCPHKAELERWKQVATALYDATRGATRPMVAINNYLDLIRGKR